MLFDENNYTYNFGKEKAATLFAKKLVFMKNLAFAHLSLKKEKRERLRFRLTKHTHTHTQ